MTLPRLLIIDDEDLPVLRRVFEDAGYDVTAAATLAHARRLLQGNQFDVVLLELTLTDGSGNELVREMRTRDDLTPVLAMSGHAESDDVAKCIADMQADRFLPKSVGAAVLVAQVKALLHIRRPAASVVPTAPTVPDRGADTAQRIIGMSPAFRSAIETAKQAASSDAAVLLLGESGTGKELVAELIHKASGRNGAYIVANCAAIPENLFESEFFGHAKGSFSGAESDRVGLLEEADGGTCFLDEIGDLPAHHRAKLLRVMEEHGFRRIGENVDRHVAVRFIAATNKNLAEEVRQGRFRKDLFYRFPVLIVLPPLRERREDIPLLAEHFLGIVRSKNPGKPISISDEALGALAAHSWPGNVREFAAAIHTAAIRVRDSGTILTEHLPEAVLGGNAAMFAPSHLPLSAVIRNHVQAVVADYGGNRSRAAVALGIHRGTVSRLLGEGVKC